MPGMSPVARPPRSATTAGPHVGRPRPVLDQAVDAGDAVVSSPANGAPGDRKPIQPATAPAGPHEGHDRVAVAVGPGGVRPVLPSGGMGGYRLNHLEIQPAKIHCPPP